MNIEKIQQDQKVQVLEHEIRARINGGDLSRVQLIDSLVELQIVSASGGCNDNDKGNNRGFNDCIGTTRSYNDCFGGTRSSQGGG